MLVDAVRSKLNNQVLLTALNRAVSRLIESFYTDVNFSMGKLSTRKFLLGEFQSRRGLVSLEPDQWVRFKAVAIRSQRVLGMRLTNKPYDEIERKHDLHRKSWEKSKKRIEAVEFEIDILRSKLSSLRDKILSLVKAKPDMLSTKQVTRAITRLCAFSDNIFLSPNECEELLAAKNKKYRKQTIAITDFEKSIGLEGGGITSKLEKFLSALADVVALLLKSRDLKKRLVVPLYEFSIDTKKLIHTFLTHRTWLLQKTCEFREKYPTRQDLQDFLRTYRSLMNCIEELLGHPTIRSRISVAFPDKADIAHEEFRLQLSIHDIFDTGENVTVLGEAGSGKTTSLQMYAWRKQTSDDKHIYFPLNWIAAHADEGFDTQHDDGREIRLLKIIVAYLQSLNCPVDLAWLKNVLRREKVVLLLDGIDEAIEKVPWIATSIAEFEKHYPNVHLVTSCRISGKYVNSLPFVAVTLLPFTAEQQTDFVSRWFSEPKHEVHKENIRKHLEEHSDLARVSTNPLLATVLCVLEGSGVVLPDSEVRLYAKWLELAVGEYDSAKGIVRLRSHRDDLRKVAMIVAFTFHMKGTREMALPAICELNCGLREYESKLNTFKTAIDELIYPCNILIPMGYGNKFGFRHLRFQEYLVAVNIKEDRNVTIGAYVNERWWHGVLHLLAQIVDVDWIIREMALENMLCLCGEAIQVILKTKPVEERAALKEIIDRHILLDLQEQQQGTARPIPETFDIDQINEDDIRLWF